MYFININTVNLFVFWSKKMLFAVNACYYMPDVWNLFNRSFIIKVGSIVIFNTLKLYDRNKCALSNTLMNNDVQSFFEVSTHTLISKIITSLSILYTRLTRSSLLSPGNHVFSLLDEWLILISELFQVFECFNHMLLLLYVELQFSTHIYNRLLFFQLNCLFLMRHLDSYLL